MEALRLGFEIELEYNASIVQLDRGDYHAGTPLNGSRNWTAERDGSLRVEGKFLQSDTAEIVSKKLRLSNYKEALAEFQKFFSRDGKHELKDVLCFNPTCGAHIHFSLANMHTPIYKYVPQQTEVTMKKIVDQKIDDAVSKKLISVKAMECFKSRYYRDYAKKVEGTRDYSSRDKNMSLNCHDRNRTYEWRSFNLVGVTTWAEFNKMFEIGVASILEYIQTMRTQGYSTKVERVADIPPKKRTREVFQWEEEERKELIELLVEDTEGI